MGRDVRKRKHKKGKRILNGSDEVISLFKGRSGLRDKGEYEGVAKEAQGRSEWRKKTGNRKE